MAIQYTNPYNLPYPQAGDPVKDGQLNMELLAKRINTIMQEASFPSATPDLASLTAALQHRRMEYFVGAASATATTTTGVGNLVEVNSYGSSAGASFADRVGASSGEIIIREEGYYRFHLFVFPAGSPGTGWLKLQTVRNGVSRDEDQAMTDGTIWETSVSAPVAVYMKPGDKVKGTYFMSSTHTFSARFSLEKVGNMSAWGTPAA